MDIDIKNRLDALLKKIEDQDSDTATLSPGISPLTEKLLLYLGVQLDNLDITTELEKLKDVEIEGPAHHQALVYDAEKEKWVNDYVEGGAAGATKLDELTDVHFSGLEDGESLVYNSASSKWINKMVDTSIFMEDIVDTDIEEPHSGQVLVYAGDEITWKNSDALINAESKISALESADSAIKSSVESVAARATALETRAANLEQEYGQQQASLIVLSSQITYATHVAEGALNNEAAEYQTNVQYFPGDYCTYQYGLYRCIGNTSGAWNNAKWERVKVCDEIKLVKSSADNAIETANSAASSAASAWDKAENAIGVASSAANVAATALESAMTAYSNAESAMTSANEAVGVAESALSSASGAYEVAGSALSSSSEAYSLASMAAASASEAWRVASSAAATAESALGSAESAFSLANAAKESAEAAYITADSAVSIAIGASEDASEALSSAQAAYSAAQGAKTSAQSAIQIASSAMTLASAATTSAQTAIETANAAKTSADLAYGTANSALSSAEYAYASASSAFYVAGVALADASAAGILAQSAAQQAVDAAITANSALLDAGTAMTTANSAFASASDAITFAQAAQASANSAISIATDASNSAAAAYTSAQTAISTADSALTSAQGAYMTAGQAKTSAQSAYSKAESALSSAEVAYGTAESALTSASSAYTYAAQAKTSAQTAYNTANAAASDAADALLIAGVAASDAAAALDSASTAITTANSALTSAQTAYTTASAAKTSAQSAYTMADEAKTSAATAISTANSAKTSATTAYNTASAAKTSADIAYTTADSAYVLASAALPNTTKYGSSITVSINSTNYKITTTLKDQDGNTLGNAQTIDLPLESVVVNGTFDSANKKIVLTLQNGNTVDIPVGDLVAGLQTEITDENKLNSDLVTDSNQTHKFVTAAQISKLNGIAAGAEVNVQSDWNVSDSTSDAFIKNKPTIPAAQVKSDWNATSGVSQILNKPTIPAAQVNSDWNAASGVSKILNKPTIPDELADLSDDSTHRLVSDTEKAKWNATSVFKELTTEDLDNVKEVGFYVGKAGNTCANKPSGVVQFGLQVVKLATDAVYYKQILTRPTSQPGDEYVRTCYNGTWQDWKKRVDFSGSYNDLSNQPTIPTVNNATLTIQKNGTTISTFTANASSNVTANITVPTKTSELTNNSGFLTLTNGELQLTDTNARLKDTTVARVFSIEPASGGAVQLHYSVAGNHGLYSRGYGSSLTDSSTFTEDATWIIYRNSTGYVIVPKWANMGDFLTPISFNEYGSPSVSKGQTIPYIVGTGTTAGTWIGTLSGLTAYYDGLLILYKTPVAGATTTTLNLNSLGAKTIYTSGTSKLTTHFPINQPMLLVYSTDTDDGCWKAIDFYNSDTRPQAQCNTGASTAAKAADMTYFTATDKSYLMVNIRYANTSKSKLTLNVNSTGAKDIYINGAVSSSTNYTLPAGSYLVYYNDSKYYFRTDGKITGEITGNAATVGGYTVGVNVPSSAVFTDEKVKITNDITSSNLRVLLGTSQNDTTVTESIKKSTALNFNPSSGVLYTPRIVIKQTDTSAPLIIDTSGRSSTAPANGDDLGIVNGAYKKNASDTIYNSIISMIGNTVSNASSVRFGSSSGATIITSGAKGKPFPKVYEKHNSSAIWLASESEVQMYTNIANTTSQSHGGHVRIHAGGIEVERTDQPAGTIGEARLILGNSTSRSSAGASRGVIRLYDGASTNYAVLNTNTLSATRTLHLPNSDGTLVTDSDVNTIVTTTFNNNATDYTSIMTATETSTSPKTASPWTLKSVINNLNAHCFFGTCTTAGGTAAKSVTMTTYGFIGLPGSMVGIKFTESDQGAGGRTITVPNVASGMAWYNGAAFNGGGSVFGSAGHYNFYMWDGTYWVYMGTDH